MVVALAAALASSGARAASFECLVEPWQVVEIRSPVEGLIERITVQRGDAIKKGQLLVELQSAAERSAVDAARYRAGMEGRVASARNRLDYANKKLERVSGLIDQNFVTAQARDEAEAEKRSAESELQDALESRELARIEYRRAQDLLNLRSLQSPINGVVVERLLNVGDIAEAGTGRKAILKVAQTDPLRVEVLLPVQAFGKMRVGMVGQVAAEGFSGRHAATVRVVDTVFDAASATFGVRLELPNPGGRLPAGLRCQVEFDQMPALEAPVRRQRGS
jgi:RND family efflux transporter MFP subunit